MIILDGKSISKSILNRIEKDIKKTNIKLALAVILIGNDSASQLYVKIKEKKCQEVGIGFVKYEFPDDVSQNKIVELIEKLNHDKKITGIIVQLPLPSQLDTNKIISIISLSKDVDGLNVENLGKLLIGDSAIVPPTPAGIMEMLQFNKISLKGKHVVLVGYGKLVGKPLAAMLATSQKDATITICNKDTKNLSFYTRQADILITATGVPNLIRASMIKKGTVVIDAGTTIINQKSQPEADRPLDEKLKNNDDSKKLKSYPPRLARLDSARLAEGEAGNLQARVVGDVDFEKVKKIAGAITPPIGGIGPLTVAKLIENVYEAGKK